MKINRCQEIKIPQPPNFVRLVKNDVAIPVSELSADELIELRDEWFKALLIRVREQIR